MLVYVLVGIYYCWSIHMVQVAISKGQQNRTIKKKSKGLVKTVVKGLK